MVIAGLVRNLKLSKSLRIIRRYLVINGFDGSIVTLGLIFGFFLAGLEDTRIIVSAGLGAAIAMCISGFSGVYLSEKAEKEKELKDIETAMVKKLGNTKIGEALRLAPLITALVDGLSPFIFSLIILLPFLLSGLFAAPIKILYYTSFALCALCLFVLGMFMGKTAKNNVWLYGVKTLAIGLITAAILIIFDFALGP